MIQSLVPCSQDFSKKGSFDFESLKERNTRRSVELLDEAWSRIQVGEDHNAEQSNKGHVVKLNGIWKIIERR